MAEGFMIPASQANAQTMAGQSCVSGRVLAPSLLSAACSDCCGSLCTAQQRTVAGSTRQLAPNEPESQCWQKNQA